MLQNSEKKPKKASKSPPLRQQGLHKAAAGFVPQQAKSSH